MASPIEIEIASEGRAFRAGIDADVIKPLENADEALEKLGKNKGLDELDRDLEQAQRESKELKKEIAKTADELEAAGRAARKMGDQADAGLGRAEQAAGEFKDEFKQNMAEALSSFDGSMSSVGDLAQGTLGGVTANLPGAFAVAGVGAAVGVGLITAAIEQAEERRKELEERASDLAGAYIDAGSEVLDALTIASRSAAVLSDPEQAEELKTLTAALGDESLAVRVLAGDKNALALANGIASANQAEYEALVRSTGQAVNENLAEETARMTVLEQAAQMMAEYNEVQATAAEKARTYSDVLKDLVAQAGPVAEQVDELGNKLYTLPDGSAIIIEADTGLASDKVDRFKGDVDGIVEKKTVTLEALAETNRAADDLDRLVQQYSNKTITVTARVRDEYGKPVI